MVARIMKRGQIAFYEEDFKRASPLLFINGSFAPEFTVDAAIEHPRFIVYGSSANLQILCELLQLHGKITQTGEKDDDQI